jgi:uncharacterized protein (DUF1810 family)
MDGGFELERYVVAQDAGGTYGRALAELRAGQKRSHWMWFVFPQLAGLGRSPLAQRYGISSLDEARAYLAHPVLGPRLLEASGALLAVPDRSAEEILGGVDALKLCSSMTLFGRADPGRTEFREVIRRFFDGQADEVTLRLLAQAGGA